MIESVPEMTNPESWLYTISVLAGVMIAFLFLSSIPVTQALRSRFQLLQSAMKCKKLMVIVMLFSAISWFLAWIAPHIMNSPPWRVNSVAMSQLLFTITTVLFIIILSIRVMQRNNTLVLFYIMLKRSLPLVVTILGGLASIIFYLFLESISDNVKKQEQLAKEHEPYRDPKSHMNYNGDYCDKNKSNWYF